MGGDRNGGMIEVEYVVEDVKERISSSAGSRYNLVSNLFNLDSSLRKFSRESVINGIKYFSRGCIISPDSR